MKSLERCIGTDSAVTDKGDLNSDLLLSQIFMKGVANRDRDPDPQGSVSFWEAGSGSESNTNYGIGFATNSKLMNRPMIADLHHFVEEQNADPGPHSIKVNSRIRIYVKRGNRI
jgi:hypothetical protein